LEAEQAAKPTEAVEKESTDKATDKTVEDTSTEKESITEDNANNPTDSTGSIDDSLDKIIEKVIEGSGKKEDEIKKLIEEKQDELSGLVSEEGAAYIVARELGINLLKATKRQLKIKNLMPGLRSIDIVARVIRVFEAREWSKGDRSGKVASLILGDETGTVRLSLWNDEIDAVMDKGMKEGSSVKITGAYVKMDNRGQPDLRIGRGNIEEIADGQVTLPRPEEITTTTRSQRREIKDFKEGEFGETRACLVQVFNRSRPFYEVCPQCGGRLSEDNGKFECREHGQVEPDYQMVASGVIDDGTANMRVVFFRDMAEKVLGRNVKELRDELSKGKSHDDLYKGLESLGMEFVFQGRIKRNDLSGNLEFVANEVKDVDVKSEANKLMEQLKNN